MHDFAKGGAWPLLVGEVICLLNCVNERDLCQLLDSPSVCRLVTSWSRPSGFRLRSVWLSLTSAEEAARKGDALTGAFRLLIGIMQSSNCIETRAQSRSVMLLKCSGLHAHYTDSASELLLRTALRVCLSDSLARRGWGIF